MCVRVCGSVYECVCVSILCVSVCVSDCVYRLCAYRHDIIICDVCIRTLLAEAVHADGVGAELVVIAGHTQPLPRGHHQARRGGSRE